ncbi:hypothetical protein ACHQM5_008786 [Ranunculus cassubicifolius]
MINHYEVLGLPSDKTSILLTQNDITKAYRSKALELHPDKCPNDPQASTKFQNLKSSYEILINPNTRKIVDNNLLQTDEDRRRRSAAEERATTLMKWMEYERMKDAFMWKLVSKNT